MIAYFIIVTLDPYKTYVFNVQIPSAVGQDK